MIFDVLRLNEEIASFAGDYMRWTWIIDSKRLGPHFIGTIALPVGVRETRPEGAKDLTVDIRWLWYSIAAMEFPNITIPQAIERHCKKAIEQQIYRVLWGGDL